MEFLRLFGSKRHKVERVCLINQKRVKSYCDKSQADMRKFTLAGKSERKSLTNILMICVSRGLFIIGSSEFRRMVSFLLSRI